MTSKLPIVSVFFEDDLTLQILQALSVDRLFDPESLSEYLLILNSDTPEKLKESFLNDSSRYLSRELRSKLRFAVWEDFFEPHEKVGRYNQQALKLAVSSVISQDDYLLLDAKNHFVRESSVVDFLIEGRRLTALSPVSTYWKRFLEPSFELLGIDPARANGRMMPSITPYVMNTRLTRDLVAMIEARARSPLPIALNESGGATEFLLYYAYLVQTENLDFYFNGRLPVNTLFTIWPQDEKLIAEKIEECRRGDVPIFGLHRNRIPQLSVESRELLFSMWHEKLLAPWEDASWFLGP